MKHSCSAQNGIAVKAFMSSEDQYVDNGVPEELTWPENDLWLNWLQKKINNETGFPCIYNSYIEQTKKCVF